MKRLKSRQTARFGQEARAIAALNPNICQIHHIGPDFWCWRISRARGYRPAVRGPVTWSVMDAKRLNSILREFREGLGRIYGERLVRLVLFGSQARNDAKPDSDIDVMVVLRGAVRDGEEIDRTSFLRAELCSKHLTVISCVYVSEEEFSRENSPFMLNVRREGVLV